MKKVRTTRWTIVQAAQAGDEDAVRALVERYRPAVVSFLEQRGAGSEAEDLAQEVMLQLLQKALHGADRSAGRFRSLVFAIARNLLGKHRARQDAHKRGGGRVVSLGQLDVAAAAEDELFDREWLRAMVKASLDKLASEHPAYYEAMRRSTLEDEAQAAIADDLGVTVNTIKKRVHRGKKKLGGYLRDEVWSYTASPEDYELELRCINELLEGERVDCRVDET